jgi:UDP:flavonoid glycosyltransferase YjiC (YdhE family)
VQIQAICGMMARRPDALHLVVVWPTATLQPGWFAWPNTRIVRTHYAGALAAAADLCISAAGYNSFHEMLYNGIAAIFVPQTGAFMDDQRARARAASDRGLAVTLEPSQLMTLDREVDRALDGGEAAAMRARLAALELPAPGNRQAARVIEEVMHGCPALERDPGADHRPRRG